MMNKEMKKEMEQKFKDAGFDDAFVFQGSIIRYTKQMGDHVGLLHIDFNMETATVDVYSTVVNEQWSKIERWDKVLETTVRVNDDIYFLIAGQLVALGWCEEVVRFVKKMQDISEKRGW